MPIRNSPTSPSTFTTSALFRISMFGCSPTSDSFGASMQTEQSSVGKFLSSAAILPPMDGPFSTSTTRAPASARSSAAWTPAMPPPMTRTESLAMLLLPAPLGVLVAGGEGLQVQVHRPGWYRAAHGLLHGLGLEEVGGPDKEAQHH